MRKYDKNSPLAAERIIALTLIADGDVGQAELDLLGELAVHQQLDMDRDTFLRVIDNLCEDLLSSNQLAWSDNCPVDEYTLARLMAEIDHPVLRNRVHNLCIRLADADQLLAKGESAVLQAVSEHWGMRHPRRQHFRDLQEIL